MKYLFLMICLCLSVLISSDETVTDRAKCHSLSEIKSRGKLLVGIYNDDPYFSFLNPTTYQLEGFDVDVARAIASDLMGDADKVEFVIVDSNNRLEALEKGKADLVIAELSITDKRREVVDFSDVYYVAGQSILVNADSPYHALSDLKGKDVGALAGSTNTMHVKKVLPESKFVYFQNLSSGFQALRQQQVQAFCIDDVLLLALRGDSKRVLKDYRFIGGEIAWESYGIAVNKGCTQLLDAVNLAIRKIKADGRWQKIYDANIGKVSHVSARPPV